MTGTPKPSAPRWMRLALVASLAVNLAVAGIVLGSVFGDGPDRRAPRPGAIGLGPFADALSETDRAAVMRAYREEAGAFRDNRAAFRAQFNDLLTALRAEPYDPGTVREIIGAQDAKLAERVRLGRALLLERLDTMTATEREAYAERLEDNLRRGPRGRDQRDSR